MNIYYETQTTVAADIKFIWDLITHNDFARDFFPEIQKQPGRGKKKNKTVLPSYAISEKFISWTQGAGLLISLPRKDIQANIESIEISLEPYTQGTRIKLKAIYAPELDKDFLFLNRCVRSLMKKKLEVLKSDVNDKNVILNSEVALAY